MKFLVLWSLEIKLLSPQMMSAVLKQQEHAKKLVKEGKLLHRYHVVGRHGGAWIYDVGSNEELDRLLASSPAFNYATYDVLPLAEMQEDAAVVGELAPKE